MIAAELKYHFDIKLKALTDIKEVVFESVDINRLMQESELDFIRMAYQTFDKTELEKKLVGNLVANFNATYFTQDATANLPNGWSVDLPSDVMFVLEEHLITGTSPEVVVPVKPVTYDTYLRNINNPFKCPYDELAWRMDYGGTRRYLSSGTNGYSGYSGYSGYAHEIVTDGTVPTKYVARYVRVPRAIDIDNDLSSELHPNYHLEIVNGAVKLAYGIIQARMSMEKSKGQPQQEANNDNQNKQ